MKKPLPAMASENPNLPDDMLIEIFSRLPARTVGRCRCLSTLWRSWLSNLQFLKLHFSRRKPHAENLFIITAARDKKVNDDNSSIYTMESLITTTTTTEESALKKLDDLLPANKLFEVVGSVNGLILVEGRFRPSTSIVDQIGGGDLVLLNPVTREHVSIRRPPRFHGWSPYRFHRMYGFGYDISTDDYKIVTLGRYLSGEYSTGVSVLSVKKKGGLRSWVLKDNFPSHIDLIFTTCRVNAVNNGLRANALLNGAIHWIGSDKHSGDSLAIVAFDLATEEFRQVPAPPVRTPNYVDGVEFCGVYVFGGCLCIIEMFKDQPNVEAWVMKEYGLQESWVKFTLFLDKPGLHLAPTPLCYIGEDQVLLMDQMSLLLSNVKENTMKKVILTDGDDVVADGCVFVESLVSPKHLAWYGGK